MIAAALLFCVSALAGGLANAAVYEWAWDRRRLSPWQPTPEGVRARSWADRVPIVGWLRLRRDAGRLGTLFWLRPMVVELLAGALLAWLYLHEVRDAGLITPQPGARAASTLAISDLLMSGFIAHAVLAWLMLVASLIDLDEKTIPDEVTLPGTLIGLVLAAALPLGMLPNVEMAGSPTVERSGVSRPLYAGPDRPLATPDGPITVEPTHVAAPSPWPASLAGGPSERGSLLIGLGCYGFWCFAIAPRRWRRGSRSRSTALAVLLRRVGRSFRTRPLREVLLGGLLGVTAVWYTGGDAWQGLLTALVGVVLSGGMVWAVRLVGSAALGREAMGFGDVTLMMMVGAYVGWQAGLLAFFLAPFAGLLVGVAQLVLRRDDVIPYGPFLCLATAGVVVGWGHVWPRFEPLFAVGTVLPIVLVVCLAMLGVLLAAWRAFKTRVLGMSEDWADEPA